MSKAIFERQFFKLKLRKYVSEVKHCNELADAGYYTESFLALWILVEMISKNIQVTYRTSIAADKISSSLLKKLYANNINIEKNNLRNQIIDVTFFQIKGACTKEREYVVAGDVISGLKLVVTVVDEEKLKFLLASKVDEAPFGFSSKTTIRARRNDLVHKNRKISKGDFTSCMDYFDYFFSLTALRISATDEITVTK